MVLNRLLTLMIATLTAGSALAAGTGRLECNQGPDRPMYQITRKDANTFAMRIYFPGGDTAIPLYSGDVMIEDLEKLKHKADFIKQLGNTYTAEFPASQCIRRNNDDGLFYVHCFTKTPVVINGVTLSDSVSFHADGKKTVSLTPTDSGSTVMTDKVYTVGFEVGVRTTKNTKHYLDFARTYGEEECTVDSEFWK